MTLDPAERLVLEPNKRPGRTPYERDRARVLHSAALRRLSAKTQVMGAGTDDFVRNRLTHSLEVAQISRELGKSIGCDPDIADSAALAHDLGHPPFGHNGEVALNAAAEPCGGFEGNAQTLRIVTRLEAKTYAENGKSVGLNLTRATLDACIKYPWAKDEIAGPKFGVYEDDRPVFEWIRRGVAVGRRCLEAQVMDLADDIAYSVHDVEDAIVGGWFTLDQAIAESAAVWHVARDWYEPGATDFALDAALDRLRAMPEWPSGGFDGTHASLSALKRLTSALIGRFVSAARSATAAKFGDRPFKRYEADLVVPSETRLEITALKSAAAHFVMRSKDRSHSLHEQREMIKALVSRLSAAGDRDLEPLFAEQFRESGTDVQRLRVVVDQVASLTDASARTWARRLLD